MEKQKILVIVGPTASGKSNLAAKLAKKLNGEIISADSRQVYKGLDIGTGKITKKEMRGIPHHLIDVIDPKKQFSVAEYKKLAEAKVRYIVQKDKLPIVVGGTGFYIDALTGRANFPDVAPNKLLRSKLSKLSKEKLFKMLQKKDQSRARTIDPQNKVRLIRALEIIEALGLVPPLTPSVNKRFQFIFTGLKPVDLDKRILKRLMKRIPGILRETKKLSRKRAFELGLEYRFASLYLQKKLSKKEFVDKLYTAIRHYAKRQMTWFKRNKKIRWFDPRQLKEIEKHAKRQHF